VSFTPHRGLRAVAAAAALALLAGPLTLAGGADAQPRHPGLRPIELDLLAINDFHGQLEKLDGSKSSSGRINDTFAGGAEYLATHLDRLRAAAHDRGAHTITVAAGDLIGATPLLSAAFHDEPTVEAMNDMGLQIASVGNHEFDEGYRELLRLQNGGCIADGDGADNQNSCPDPDHPFTGANYQYLSANVKYTDSGRTVFPGYTITKVDRVKVGFIGMTLEDTPNIVTKSGVEGLTFTDEVETANALVPTLRAQGVRSIVVLLHQGGVPGDPKQYDGCAGVTGPGVDIAEQLDPAIDVVITGHTHQAYNCTVQDPAGHPRLLTSASSLGRLVTDVSLQIDPRTKDVIRPTATAHNHIVTNSDGTAARADITDLITRYQKLVAPIAGKVLGQIAPAESVDTLTRTADVDGGDSSLGNLIADSQLRDESPVPSGGATPVVALMNPGGIRNDLVEDGAGNVTYSAAFAVQPFNNYVVSETLTGQQLLDVLNQQWNGRNEGAKNNKILQVSGLSYTWDQSEAALTDQDALVPGSVQLDLDRDGTAETPLVPSATYRVVVNSFLADGGDGFPTLGQGTDKYFGGLDIDALAGYLAAHNPYTPAPTTRISSVS
jgi:5'-nucleotidase